MRRDVMHFFNADVRTVYQAYLTAAQNPPFSRNCEQKPFYSFQFGLNFSMKYNMNGGSCTLHFIPYGSGTAVDLRFSVAQLVGARYEAYDRALADKVISILRVPAQPLKINVEEFLQPANWVTGPSELPGVTNTTTAPPVQPPAPPSVPPVPPVVSPEPPLVPPVPPVVPPEPPSVPQENIWQPARELTEQPGKTCAKCASPLLPGARFCTTCGALVAEEKVCCACGKPLLPGAAFCTFCGQKQ